MIHGMLCAWTAHFLTCKWAAIQRQMWVLWSIERVMVTEAIFTFEDAQAFTWWEAPLLLYRLLLKVFCDISGENKGAQQEEWNLSLVYLSRKPWCRGSSVLRVRHLMPLPVPEPRTGTSQWPGTAASLLVSWAQGETSSSFFRHFRGDPSPSAIWAYHRLN